MPPRVLLAEDHAVVRESLRALLSGAGLPVIAEACNGDEAVRRAAELTPDVAVLDVSMPLLNGIDAARSIARVSPRTRTVLLTMHSRDPYVADAAQAGVFGYVLKTRAASDLIEAIHAAAAGRLYASDGVARAVFEQRAGPGAPVHPILSARERQVLQLIAEGRSNKDIGALLGIEARTVECHRANIMSRLGIRRLPGLVRYAVRSGLIDA